jgi:hypothetical protein
MDVHVPRAITVALRARGVDVVTAQEDQAALLPDCDLLDRASAHRRVLFSRDEDLPAETTARQRSGRTFSGLIYAHQLRVTVGQCVNDLELIAKLCEPDDLLNRVEHLPLRQPP